MWTFALALVAAADQPCFSEDAAFSHRLGGGDIPTDVRIAFTP